MPSWFSNRHDTTVRRLVERTRESHARQLLEDDRLGVAEVALIVVLFLDAAKTDLKALRQLANAIQFLVVEKALGTCQH